MCAYTFDLPDLAKSDCTRAKLKYYIEGDDLRGIEAVGEKFYIQAGLSIDKRELSNHGYARASLLLHDVSVADQVSDQLTTLNDDAEDPEEKSLDDWKPRTTLKL